MSNQLLLIFDLDDTIFETKLINKESVQPIFDDFERLARNLYSHERIDEITKELWKYPFDFVSKKHQFSDLLNQQFSQAIKDIDYQLNIQAFDDFKIVRNIQAKKNLVTTGFRKLQLAKSLN